MMGQEAFEAVVAAHHGEIYRYLVRVTGRPSEADDLSQETFLRAYRSYRSLPPDAHIRGWLFTIASNLCRNQFRANKRRRTAYATVGAGVHDTGGDGPEEAALFNEIRALIEAIVGGLPLRQRLAFILRKIHGLDYEAVARTLDCSAESARAHVYQALRKIREGLNGHELLPKEQER
ncbi:MAG: RNA polymerase sigma factor [Candidatus Methylomirabilia bacterium]